jgi:hypothetical protein
LHTRPDARAGKPVPVPASADTVIPRSVVRDA